MVKSAKLEKPLKLNLGCGNDKRIGWINIDALPQVKPDLVHDLVNPLPFKDNTVSEVLAQDILEHFTYQDVLLVVGEIARVLVMGGRLTVRVPNIDDIVQRFEDDPEVRNLFIYGEAEETGIFGVHKNGFTLQSLIALMLKFGLTLVKVESETTNWVGQFEKTKVNLRLRRIDGIFPVGTEMPFEGLQRVVVTNYSWRTWMSRQGGKPDVLVLAGWWEKLVGSIIGQLRGIPVVWLELVEGKRRKNGFFEKGLISLLKHLPERVVANSDEERNRLIRMNISQVKIVNLTKNRNLKKICEDVMVEYKAKSIVKEL